MELQAAEQLAWKLMQEFGAVKDGWMFYFDDAKRRFGSCSHSYKRISLSRELTLRNDQPEVENTIRHELAHYIAGHAAGHSQTWKGCCAITGAKPERCYDYDDVDSPKGDWRATCRGCGTLHSKFRRPTGGVKFCAVKRCTQQHGHRNEIQALEWRHKNAIEMPSHPTATAEAKRAGVEHMKEQLRREHEMEEMKTRIAELESKLGRK